MPITNFVFFKIYNQALLEKLIDKTWGDEYPSATINYGRILMMDFDIWLSKKFNSSDNDEYCNLQNFKSFLKNYYQLENEKKRIKEDYIKKGRIEVGLEKDEIESTEKPTNLRPQKKIVVSYQWQGDAEKELPELYSKLVKDMFIDDKQCGLKAFTAIFTGQPIETIKPIKWGIAKNLLPYFIDGLMNKHRISKKLQNDIWAIAEQCFIDANSLSQLKDQYTNNKTAKPKHYKLIDDILNTL